MLNPDQLLLASLIKQESGGNPMAVSPKGAAGIMQIMPDTARDPGYGVMPLQGWDGKDPRTAPVAEQIRFGRDYLEAMKRVNGGDTNLALAAYNAGQGAVEKYNGIPPFKETQDYVRKINANRGVQMASADNIMTDAGAQPVDWRARAQPITSEVTSDWRSRAQAVDWRANAQPVQIGEDMGGGVARVQGFNSAVPFGERIAAGLGAAGAAAVTGEKLGKSDVPTWARAMPGGAAVDLISRVSNSDLYKEARANQKATEAANQGEYLTGALLGTAATLPMASTKVINGARATTGARGAVNAIPEMLQGVGTWVRGSQAASNAGTVAKAANLGGKAVRSAAVAAPTGALYSYGASDNQLDTKAALGDAASGAGLGALVGGSLPVVGAAVGKVSRSLLDKVSGTLAKASGEIPKNLNLTKEEKKIYERLLADYGTPQEVARVLNSYASTKGQALVERGQKNLSNLAEASALFPTGNAKAGSFFDESIGAAPDRLKRTISKTVSASDNFVNDLDEVVRLGREKAAPLYTQAFKDNPAIKSKVIDRILQTPEGKRALGEAAKNMQNELALVATPDPELTALAREAGMQATGSGVASGLKLRTLDYVKRAMDDGISSAQRAGDNGEARRLIGLRNGLLNELDSADAGGAYARARAVSGDYLSSKGAMEAGLDFLRTDSEVLAKQFSKMKPAEREAYKMGAVRALRKDIENRFDGQNVARLFNKTATRQKLQTVLSQPQYEKLQKDAEAIDKIYKLRNQVLSGSSTAKRTIAAEEFTPEMQDFVKTAATSGATRAILDKGVSLMVRQFKGLSDESAGEVARMLYATDPQEKYAIVKRLSQVAKTKNPQGLQAANKLKAFYAMSDFIAFKGKSASTDALIPALLTAK